MYLNWLDGPGLVFAFVPSLEPSMQAMRHLMFICAYP